MAELVKRPVVRCAVRRERGQVGELRVRGCVKFGLMAIRSLSWENLAISTGSHLPKGRGSASVSMTVRSPTIRGMTAVELLGQMAAGGFFGGGLWLAVREIAKQVGETRLSPLPED